MTIKSNAMGSGVPARAANSLIGTVTQTTYAAAGSTQATATLLPLLSGFLINSGTGGVILPPGTVTGSLVTGPASGDWIDIINQSGSSINVYPPTGGKIQNGSVNAAFAVGNNKMAHFKCINGTDWAAILSA